MSEKTANVLIEARARIDTPEKWERMSALGDQYLDDDAICALDAACQGLGEGEPTHDELMAIFDKAIATERAF